MSSRIVKFFSRMMSGGRWSRFLAGTIFTGLIGAGFLAVGLMNYLAVVLLGFEKFSFEFEAIREPLTCLLLFSLAGGVVGLLWKLTTNLFGAMLAGFLGVLALATACVIVIGFEQALPPLAEVVSIALPVSALCGAAIGLAIWWVRRAPDPNPRVEKRLDELLAGCGANRESLSAEQLDMLRNVCRLRQAAKWGLVVNATLGVLMIYFGLVYAPGKLIPVLTPLTSSQLIIVDRAAGTTKTIGGEDDAGWVKVIFTMGTAAGFMGAMGIFSLGQAISNAFTIWGRDPLVRFLKAAAKPTPHV